MRGLRDASNQTDISKVPWFGRSSFFFDLSDLFSAVGGRQQARGLQFTKCIAGVFVLFVFNISSKFFG